MTTTMQLLPIDKLTAVLSRQTMIYRRAVYLWGRSGIGKSYGVKAWAQHEAKKRGLIFWEIKYDAETGGITQIPEDADPKGYFGFMDLRAVLMDVLDVKGAPYIDREADMTRFARPSLLPDVKRHGFFGALFLDEFAQTTPMVSNGFSQLIYDRRIGDSYVYPEQWAIVAAGNRKEDNAATSKAGAHIYNRFGHYEVTASGQGLHDWLLANGFDAKVAKFSLFKQTALNSYQKGDIVFPTSRSMETVSVIVSKQAETGLSDLEMEQDIAAHIGVGLASELTAFLDCFNDLVPYREIVANPNTARVPQAGHGGATASTYALFSVLLTNVCEREMDSVMQYVDRFEPEFQTMFVLDLKTLSEGAKKEGADPALKKRAAFLMETLAVSKWRANHPNAV